MASYEQYVKHEIWRHSWKRQNDFIRGILTESLNREDALETFELLDRNHDGNLTVQEIGIVFGDDVKGKYQAESIKGGPQWLTTSDQTSTFVIEVTWRSNIKPL